MRKRTKETLAAILFLVGVPAAITAPLWLRPRWIGLTLAVFGCVGYAYFVLGQYVLFWEMIRGPVAKRPWILGGPPNPSPERDRDERKV